MKLMLETKKGTDDRKIELEKLKIHLQLYFEGIDPFSCYKHCENYERGCNKECVTKHINNFIKNIDEEGIYYI